MGTSNETPKKSLAQKGQGMLEYALMMSFVAMVYLIVFADGGFGGAITGTFDNASETLVMASEKNSSGDFGDSSASGFLNSVLGSSSSSSSTSSGGDGSELVEEHHTIEYIASNDYVPLDWHTVIKDMEFAYGIVVAGTDPNLSIKSEYNLFSALGSMVSGTREYIYKDENLKGWNDLMNQMGSQIEANNFTTSYKKTNTEESLDIKREGNKVVMTYAKDSDTKTFSIYAEANEMKFESNTGSEIKYGEAALTEYTSIGGAIYSGGWQFASN